MSTATTTDQVATDTWGGHQPLPQVASRNESALSVWAEQSLVQSKRLLIGWSRDPSTTVQALIYPALTLLMFHVVLGNSISAATGAPAVYGQVPMVMLVAAMTGSVISALGFKIEKATGLLGRFYTMPVHRAAGFTGRLLAEAGRVLVTSLFVLLVGVCLGFRFWFGPAAAIGMVALPVLFGIAFAVLVTALATLTEGILLVSVIGIISNLLMFFNSGFVPVYAYPRWLQTVVGNQPMSTTIDAMRGLAYDGPILNPLWKTLAWTLGTIVLFAYPAVRGYRRAAETGA